MSDLEIAFEITVKKELSGFGEVEQITANV